MKRLLLLLLLALPVFSQHAYWRMNITQGGSAATSISEWKFFDVGSSQIATTGGTASASILNGNAPNAFDGNTGTFWNSGSVSVASPEWLRYQFASAVDPTSFTIENRTSSNQEQVPYDLTVQYSDNGSAWTDFYQYFGLPWTNSLSQVITLDSAHSAPLNNAIGISWRILITADSAGQDTSLAELQFFDGTGTLIPTTQYAAISSSSFGNGELGFNAFDGNAATDWASAAIPSGGSPQWIGFRFASSSISPATFSITARAAIPTQSPSAFSLQYSTDESTWTTVQSYTAAAWTTGGQVQTFGGVQRARHRVNTE